MISLDHLIDIFWDLTELRKESRKISKDKKENIKKIVAQKNFGIILNTTSTVAFKYRIIFINDEETNEIISAGLSPLLPPPEKYFHL